MPDLVSTEFERAYAERSGMTVAELRRMGIVMRRCKCGETGCEGWQALTQARIDDAERSWREGVYRKPDWIDD